MSNMAYEMAVDHAIMDVDAMSKEEVVRYVDSRVVLTRPGAMTFDDYFDKAVELMMVEWENRQ